MKIPSVLHKITKFCLPGGEGGDGLIGLKTRTRLLCTSPEKEQKRFLIPFHGEKISVVQQKDEELLVPLRELCNNLGVSWKGQYKRIKEDPVLNSVVSLRETTAIDGKSYDTLTLPLKYLNGFLFTISDKRLKNEEAKKKLALYKTECYDVLFKYFNQGFALNTEKLKEPSAKEALVCEVRKVVTPLAFKFDKLQYTYLAEENVQYGKTVLKHSLESYFNILKLVDFNIDFKDLKKGVSRFAPPNNKKLVAIKGIKGRQNLYDINVFKSHILSLPLSTRESLSELGYDIVYSNIKKFILDSNGYCFDGQDGAISMHTDIFFETLIQRDKNYLLLRNIVYIIQCKNSNFYVGSHLTQMKDRFRDHELIKNGNFESFVFLIQCHNDLGAPPQTLEHSIFYQLSKITLRSYEDFEKSGASGFKVSLEILSSCVTDVFMKKAPELSFIKSEKLLQASQWVKSLQENTWRE